MSFKSGLVLVASMSRRSFTVGPAEVVLFGTTMPVWSVIYAVVGVLMARRVAPATIAGRALGRIGNAALTVLLLTIVSAIIVAGEKRPIVALGWAIGVGFSGLGFVEMIARAVIVGGRLIMDAFVAAVTKGAAAWSQQQEK